MNAIVTGGCGFIGSNLVWRLLKEGHKVLVIDNLHTGTIDNLPVEQWKHADNQVEKTDGTTYLKPIGHTTDGLPYDYSFMRSMTPLSKIKYLCYQNNYWFKPDVIFHLGIPSSSPMYKDNNYLVGTTINEWLEILNFARDKNIPVIFASSSSVYNGNYDLPWKEDMTIQPTDYYTECRYAMERLGEMYSKMYELPVTALRLFSVYGPNEVPKGKYANLISQFYWAIRDDQDVVVYGNGHQSRDLTYVDDVVDAFLLAYNNVIQSVENEEGSAYSSSSYLDVNWYIYIRKLFNVYNVGTGQRVSVNDMINLISELLDKKPKIKYIEPNPIKNYVNETLADTELAENELKFIAKVNLFIGLLKIHHIYKNG